MLRRPDSRRGGDCRPGEARRLPAAAGCARGHARPRAVRREAALGDVRRLGDHAAGRPGDFRWTSLFTPYNPGRAQPTRRATVETQAIRHIPTQVKLNCDEEEVSPTDVQAARASASRSSARRVTFSSAATRVGQPRDRHDPTPPPARGSAGRTGSFIARHGQVGDADRDRRRDKGAAVPTGADRPHADLFYTDLGAAACTKTRDLRRAPVRRRDTVGTRSYSRSASAARSPATRRGARGSLSYAGRGGTDQDRNVLVGGRRAPKHWYPAGTPPKERLAYYAERFSTVEVDSTYYRVPDRADGAGLGRPHAGRFRHAREGVRADDAPSGEARAGAARPARGHAGRRARPGRPAAARGARRVFREFLDALDAAARGGQARRHPVPDAAVRRLEAVVARLPRVGARAARRRPDAGRAPPPLVVRGGDPGRDAALARGAAHVVGRRRRAEGRRAATSRDGRRRHGAARLRPLPRPQRRHLEQARRLGRARASTTSTARTSCASGSTPLRELSDQAEEAYAFFNNNNQTDGVAQAPAGAQLLRKLLEEEHVPTGVMRVLAVTHGPTRPAGVVRRRDRDDGPRARRVGDRAAGRATARRLRAVLVFGGDQNVGEELSTRGCTRSTTRCGAGSTTGRRCSASASARRRSRMRSAAGRAAARRPARRVLRDRADRCGRSTTRCSACCRARFEALNANAYAFTLPPGAVELARGPVAAGVPRRRRAWAVQFHPEVRRDQVLGVVRGRRAGLPRPRRRARARARRRSLADVAGARPPPVPRVPRAAAA